MNNDDKFENMNESKKAVLVIYPNAKYIFFKKIIVIPLFMVSMAV